MDCGFLEDSRWFRYRACGIILKDNKVLMVTNPNVDYYYSVGGGVKHFETNEDAVKREVLEETGLDMEIERLVFIHENFFMGSDELEGCRCHEISFYYLMNYESENQIEGRGLTLDGSMESLEWIDIDKFGEVKAYPRFFKDYLKPLVKEVTHIVTRE